MVLYTPLSSVEAQRAEKGERLPGPTLFWLDAPQPQEAADDTAWVCADLPDDQIERWFSSASPELGYREYEIPSEIATQHEIARLELLELDGDRIQTRDELFAALGTTLGFFEKYGHNLDALWDCLEDADLRSVKAAEIRWVNSGRYRENDPEGFAKVVAQFEETSAPLILRPDPL